MAVRSRVDASRSAQSCQFISITGASASGTASGFAIRTRNMPLSLAIAVATGRISLWILNASASSVSKLELSTVYHSVSLARVGGRKSATFTSLSSSS